MGSHRAGPQLPGVLTFSPQQFPMNKLFLGEMFDISWVLSCSGQWSRTGGGMRGGTMIDAQLPRHMPHNPDPASPAHLQHCSTAVDTEEVEQPTVPSTHYCPSPSSSHTFKLSLCRKMLSVAPQPCCCCPQLGEDAMITTLPPQPRDTDQAPPASRVRS